MAGEQRALARGSRHRVGPLVMAGVVVALGFLVLGGCVSSGSSSGARPTTGVTGVTGAPSAPAATPAATPVASTAPGAPSAPVATPVAPRPPAATPAATPVAPTAPTPTPSPGALTASPIVVTAANNGTVLHLAVGQQFLLDLGSSVDWAVTVADQHVVGRVPGVLVILGAQGIYVARATGTTLLSAVGSPHCTSGVCPLFRLGFRLTITVS